MLTGYCSQCHKAWTLETERGLCQWCSKPSTCETTLVKPRHLKSRANGSQRQAEAHSNGYSELDGEYAVYYKVASRFSHKAKVQDRDDLLQDIVLTLALVAKNNGHHAFNEPAMYRIASRIVADYWRTYYRHTNGLNCGSCSQKQRVKCRQDWLYSECPKAIRLESLNQEVVDTEGNLTELGDLIADDKSLDLDAWLNIKAWLVGCPQRLIELVIRKSEGKALDTKDRKYLSRYRQAEQKRLFENVTV